MRLRAVTLGIATIALLGVATGDATENRLRIEVSPRVSAAPAAVTIRAFVTPDSANRALQIIADSGSFYRSSIIPLDGAKAALITETIYKSLPGGNYEVTVALVAADGGRTVEKRVVVVASSVVD